MLHIYCARPPFSDSTCTIKLLSKTWQECLSKHEKRLKITNCSFKTLHPKSLLQASKSLVYIDFEAQMRNPNFPQYMASFWDQIPLQMAQNPQKIHFLG
jgi:hypothetical protein